MGEDIRESVGFEVTDEGREMRRAEGEKTMDEREVKERERAEERKREDEERVHRRSRNRSGSGNSLLRRKIRIRSRSRPRSGSRWESGGGSRYGSGLFLGSRTVCLDEVGVRIKGEKSSGSKECLGVKEVRVQALTRCKNFSSSKWSNYVWKR